MIKASIIVCSYNSEKDISPSLSALVNQQKVDSHDFEIILVDDGSIDNTEKVAKKFINERKNLAPKCTYIKIEHKGLSVARNTGLFNSSGDIILYIDVDAYADELWLNNIIISWQKNQTAFSIGGRIKIRNYENKNAMYLHDYFYDESDIENIIGANMSFKRQDLINVGGFCDQFESRGDESMIFSKVKNKGLLIKENSAIVYHDRPTSIKKWLKERKYNGAMLNLINTTNKNFEFPYKFFIIRWLIIFIIILLILYFLNIYIVIFLISATFLYKIVKLRKKFIVNKASKEKYEIMKLLKWVLLCETGNWLELLGWIGFDRNNYSLSNIGTISNRNVITSVNNYDV